MWSYNVYINLWSLCEATITMWSYHHYVKLPSLCEAIISMWSYYLYEPFPFSRYQSNIFGSNEWRWNAFKNNSAVCYRFARQNYRLRKKPCIGYFETFANRSNRLKAPFERIDKIQLHWGHAAFGVYIIRRKWPERFTKDSLEGG